MLTGQAPEATKGHRRQGAWEAQTPRVARSTACPLQGRREGETHRRWDADPVL